MTRVKGHELDLRVSTLPTIHGEGVVMRVLDRESIKLDLHDMGFSSDTLAQYSALLKNPTVFYCSQAPLARVKPRHFMRLCLTWIPKR